MKNIYILFLRGVMPTGKNKVPMAQLKECLVDFGFQDVKTWIQTGNVVLKTELSRDAISVTVSRLIEEKIGAIIPVIVKTREELIQILDENPYKNAGYDISRVFFSMFNGEPENALKSALLDADYFPEYLTISTQVAYMYIPGIYGKGRLSNSFFEKKMKIVATSRNYNTITKMIELSLS